MNTLTLHPSPPAARPPRLGWLLMSAAAWLVAAYAVYFLVGTPPGDPIVKQRMLASPLGWMHVLGSALAMALGPLQFHAGLRARHRAVHIWTGRLYLLAVGGGAISGFFVAWQSLANTVGQFGFALLAMAWFTTGLLAYRRIRAGDVAAHRAWMVRNYALTYAAVMLRWQLPVLIFGAGLSASLALSITGYLCWLPNLLWAEWWLRRTPAATGQAA